MPAALVAILVFALAFAFNAVAALAIRSVVDGERWRAAWSDLFLGLMGLAFLYLVVEVGWWTAAPELAGGFFGTAAGTRGKSDPRRIF
jgi:hypothetical protein